MGTEGVGSGGVNKMKKNKQATAQSTCCRVAGGKGDESEVSLSRGT